jgi:hypothetical protein
MLADGDKPVREIREAATANGIGWRTVERSKQELGVKAVKSNFGGRGGWNWQLPHRPPLNLNKKSWRSMAAFAERVEINSRIALLRFAKARRTHDSYPCPVARRSRDA